MTELGRLTSEHVGRAAAAWRLAIVPVGSTEQHGPHMDVSTDTRIAEEFARRMADELGDAVVLCPSLPYGLSEHHERFPGTLSLSPGVYIDAVVDLLSALQRQGLPRVLIVNGHGGNIDALRIVVRRARRELGFDVASVMWSRLAADLIAKEAQGDSYGHACEIETSVAMALAPECVHPEWIRPPERPPTVVPGLAAPPNPLVEAAVWFDELSVDGTLGDPQAANVELGERIVATAMERAVAFARTFAEME